MFRSLQCFTGASGVQYPHFRAQKEAKSVRQKSSGHSMRPLPAGCSHFLAVLLFFYCFYLEKIWCFKMSFGLLYDGFIFNLPECILFLFRTEAENTSIPPVDVQMTFTKGSGTCSVYLEMQFSGAWMHIKDKRVGWELAGEKKKKAQKKWSMYYSYLCSLQLSFSVRVFLEGFIYIS